MMKHSTRRIAAAGATTGLALALVTAIAPLGALAAETETAPTSGATFDAQAQSLLAADPSVQGVGVDGDGDIVVYATVDAPLAASTEAFIDTTDNAKLHGVKGSFNALAGTEVVGGAGYGFTTADGMKAVCSIGFSAWTPEGKPGFISAGHCTEDGAATDVKLTVPSLDAAGDDAEFLDDLGTLDFSQFGGPGNTEGAEKDPASIDISAFEVTNPALTMRPGVTDWTTAGSDDLAASTSVISSVGEAEIGPMKMSGRSTGQQEGQVTTLDTWYRVTTPYASAGRFVHGFITTAPSDLGDSGGAIWQGETAVGIVSASGMLETGASVMLGSDLKNGLTYTNGYTLMLHVDAPAITSTGDVAAGESISGTAPAGTEVEITSEGADPVTVTTDDDGAWSTPAPSKPGTFDFTVTAKRGFDSSEPTAGSVNIVKAPIAAPAITAPADGATVETEVAEVSGTGTPGATVTLGADAAVTSSAAARATTSPGSQVTVDPDGTWVAQVSLSYGDRTVTATQEVDGESSPTARSSFAVVPVAPKITEPAADAAFDEKKAPTSVTGTGVNGATVSVSLDGAPVGTAVVTDGAWTLKLPAKITVGDRTMTASQTISGKSSSVATRAFQIGAAPVAPTKPTPSATPTQSASASPTHSAAPVPAPAQNMQAAAAPNSRALPVTGTDVALPVVAVAVALMIAGGALVITRRVRTSRR